MQLALAPGWRRPGYMMWIPVLVTVIAVCVFKNRSIKAELYYVMRVLAALTTALCGHDK